MMRLLPILLLACSDQSSSPEGTSADDTASPDDTAPADETASPQDTADTAASPVILAPPEGTVLWAGSRYDVVVQGATAASADGEPLACEAGEPLLCAFVPGAAGEITLEAGGASRTWSVVEPEGIHPRGDRFPVGAYELYSEEWLTDAAETGFNLAQTYSLADVTHEEWQALAGDAGLMTLGNLTEGEDEEESRAELEGLVSLPQIAWWNIPEEQRYWYSEEMAIVTGYAALVPEVDPQQRPVFMYIPGHYPLADIVPYVPYLDIIGTGAYVDYNEQPHAWMRWRVESQIQAIEEAGYTVEDRTPIAILGMFHQDPYPDPSPGDLRHDSFAAIAAGARGLLFFAWWYGVNSLDPALLAEAKEAAGLISGEAAVGEWVLRGEAGGDLGVEVLSGPALAPEFTPMFETEAQSYPSVRAVAFDHAGTRLILAVNSATEPVQARISGLDAGSPRAEVLGEERTVQPAEGAFTDDFDALGVHLYRVPLLR